MKSTFSSQTNEKVEFRRSKDKTKLFDDLNSELSKHALTILIYIQSS